MAGLVISLERIDIVIKLSNDKIEKFISFISISDIPPIELYIVPGFDTVETDVGQVGFACYIESENRIIVPEGLTDELLFTSIAHEYYHHIEHCIGTEHDEDKAEKFAYEMLDIWEKYSNFQQKFSNIFLSKAKYKKTVTELNKKNSNNNIYRKYV